ncbi:hypothetical protein GM658_28655 [Pseudoduganella eburnea]|uniref:Uncharacterized protein n=2 Tax=Massilia eburnea TaxID=1776165 RepID=A0A6L6QQW9_9BURK|nr:hypothetical protein [Massilia eburnea]
MLERLRWSAQSIAQPSAVQIALFPEFVEVADELALGWEEAIHDLKGICTHLQPAQIAAIEELDAFMASISGQSHAQLWTMDALKTSPEWQTLRELANQVLEQMLWPKTPPSVRSDIYVTHR